jgi:hypothetical protein
MDGTQFSDHFINLPNIIGYLVAAALACGPGNWLVRWQQIRLQRRLINYSSGMTLGKILEEEEKIRRFLGMELAVEIGRLEKLVYVLAVMLDQYGLITAVIILKAFFGWITIPQNSSESGELGDRLAFYNYKLDFFYVYILGNVLSLLVALALGLVGKIIAAFVKDLIGS